jgi:hypothetical protein
VSKKEWSESAGNIGWVIRGIDRIKGGEVAQKSGVSSERPVWVMGIKRKLQKARKRYCWVVKMHLLLSIPHGMHLACFAPDTVHTTGTAIYTSTSVPPGGSREPSRCQYSFSISVCVISPRAQSWPRRCQTRCRFRWQPSGPRRSGS